MPPSAGAQLAARSTGTRPPRRPRPGQPPQPGQQQFETLHPRGRGGVWIAKQGEGMTGQPSDRVAALQTNLNAQQGTGNVRVDGRYGPMTAEAVKSFQRTYGIKPSGEVDPNTREALLNPPPLTVQQVHDQEAADAALAGHVTPTGTAGAAGGQQQPNAANPNDWRNTGSGSRTVTLKDGRTMAVNGAQYDHLVQANQIDTGRTKPLPGDNPKTARSGGHASGQSGTRKRASSTSKRRSTAAHGDSGLLKQGAGMGSKKGEAKSVKQIQQMLQDLGYDLGDGGVDGKFGPDTVAALKKLQSDYGLSSDAVVGPKTRKLVNRLHSRRASEVKLEAQGKAPKGGFKVVEAALASHAASTGSFPSGFRRFNPKLHPRDRVGEFRRVLSGTGEVVLPSGVELRKAIVPGVYRVHVPGQGDSATVTGATTAIKRALAAHDSHEATLLANREKNARRRLRESDGADGQTTRSLEEPMGTVVQEATLTAKARKGLSKGEFAIPEKKAYPIHDESHARNALARVAQHGSEDEKKRVRAAVKRKYPHIGKAQESVIEHESIHHMEEAVEQELVYILLREAFELEASGLLLQEVKSSAYPGLERKPGKQNWVDKVGGLPSLIERVAKHLHYEKGRSISTAIATAVNWVKKMCATGRAFGGKVKVGSKAQAAACKAASAWEAKKAQSHAQESALILEAAWIAQYEWPLDTLVALREAVTDGGEFTRLRAKETVYRKRLEEAVGFAGAAFEAKLHPRDRLGRFRDAIAALTRGSRLDLPGGVRVRGHGSAGYDIDLPDLKTGRIEQTNVTNPTEAAQKVIQNLRDNGVIGSDVSERQMTLDDASWKAGAGEDPLTMGGRRVQYGSTGLGERAYKDLGTGRVLSRQEEMDLYTKQTEAVRAGVEAQKQSDRAKLERASAKMKASPAHYRGHSIGELAQVIQRDWRNPNYAASPYLSAMNSLGNISDSYGADSGKMVVSYFLSNSRGWKGPVAKAVKAELRRRVKGA